MDRARLLGRGGFAEELYGLGFWNGSEKALWTGVSAAPGGGVRSAELTPRWVLRLFAEGRNSSKDEVRGVGGREYDDCVRFDALRSGAGAVL